MLKKIIILIMFSFLSFSSFAGWEDVGYYGLGPWGNPAWGTDSEHPIDGMRVQMANVGNFFYAGLNGNDRAWVEITSTAPVDAMFDGPYYGTFDLRSYYSGAYVHLWVHYPETQYTLTVIGGITSGSFSSGANCPISPTIPPGQTFTGWSATNCTLNSNASIASNSITMPSNNCSVTANFSGGSGWPLTVINGSGSGTYPVNTIVPIAYTGTKTFVRWDKGERLSSAVTVDNNNLTMPEAIYTITAIESGTGDGYHVWVDNFSELSGIVTSPIVSAIDSLFGGVSDIITNLNNMQENDNNNNLNLLNGMASVGESLNETLNNNNLDLLNGMASVGESLNTTLNNNNLDLLNGMASVGQSLNDTLGTIKDDTSGIKEDTGGIKVDTGKISDGVSEIVDLLKKTTGSVSSVPGEVPSSVLVGSDYETPSNAFSLNKLDLVKGKFHSKFDPIFNITLNAPNNAILVLPFSHIPYGNMADVDVQFFNNPLFMPFIGWIREILLCCLYITVIIAVIRIVRTWEHK